MILTILWGLLGLGLIVFIHELGHFVAARLAGVTVETFSLGWGPVLLRKKVGRTEYRLSLIPIGGYCGMKGEKSLQTALEEKLDNIPQEEGSLYSVHPFKRMLIAFAGPFANILFVAVAFTIIALTGYSYQSTGTKVILASDIYSDTVSVAEQAGIRTGDTIVSISGVPINSFNDISVHLGTHPGERVPVTVERDGERLEFELMPELDTSSGTGRIGVLSWVDTEIGSVGKDSAAEIAGLRAGDIITAVDGTPVNNTVDFQKAFDGAPEKSVFTVRRGSETLDIPVDIPYTEQGTAQLGIQVVLQTVTIPPAPLFSAIGQGLSETGNMIALTVKSIELLFRGVDVTQAVSGPVRITVMLGDTVKRGFAEGISEGITVALNFLALISVSLFLMNLLPIPVLDGGLILFSFIELVRRKNISPRVMYYVQFIGIGFIAVLFVIAFSADIRYLFSR